MVGGKKELFYGRNNKISREEKSTTVANRYCLFSSTMLQKHHSSAGLKIIKLPDTVRSKLPKLLSVAVTMGLSLPVWVDKA